MTSFPYQLAVYEAAIGASQARVISAAERLSGVA